MNKNAQSSVKNITDEDFELMCDSPKEDPVIAERRRLREHEITKKLGEYLLKGYCMLGDTCSDCNCILLRTPDQKLLCVGCSDVDGDHKKTNKRKRSRKQKNKKEQDDSCNQLENKLQWAVDELTKSQNPNRINEMCSVIIKITEAIKALKIHEMASVEN